MRNKRRMVVLCVAASALFLTIFSSPSSAEYPERAVTMIVGWTPGGGGDATARGLAMAAEKLLGQPIVVVNKPGAAGVLGLDALAKAPPDGYTIGQTIFTSLTYATQLQDVPFDPLKDFDHILGYGDLLYGTFVKSDSPFKTLKDLVGYARANPGQLKYGTVGIGSANNFGMAMLSKAENIKMTPVIFKGGPEVLMAVLGGHVDAGSTTTTELVPYLNARKMRLLVSMAHVRWPTVPDVPTIRELGYNFHTVDMMGVSAPRGVPEPIMEKLKKVFREAMKGQEFLKAMDNVNFRASYSTGEEFGRLAKESFEVNSKLFMDLGIHKSQKK